MLLTLGFALTGTSCRGSKGYWRPGGHQHAGTVPLVVPWTQTLAAARVRPHDPDPLLRAARRALALCHRGAPGGARGAVPQTRGHAPPPRHDPCPSLLSEAGGKDLSSPSLCCLGLPAVASTAPRTARGSVRDYPLGLVLLPALSSCSNFHGALEPVGAVGVPLWRRVLVLLPLIDRRRALVHWRWPPRAGVR